jgi:hypothetical protein
MTLKFGEPIFNWVEPETMFWRKTNLIFKEAFFVNQDGVGWASPSPSSARR